MKNKKIVEYRREIDDEIEWDDFGRKTRLITDPKKIDALGVSYEQMRALYGADVCIKVFVAPQFQGKTGNFETSVLCNTYFGQLGIAPRVFQVATVYGFLAIVTEYIKPVAMTDEEIDRVRRAIINESYKVEWVYPYMTDMAKSDSYRDGKFVDFHGFTINHKKIGEWLYEEIAQRTHWGRKDNNRPFSYQDYGDVTGKRRVSSRAIDLGFDRIDFQGKTVVDIGCNLGMMTIECLNRGATHATGFDLEPLAYIAQLYHLTVPGSTPVIIPRDMKKYGLPNTVSDVVLFLAMRQSLGLPSQLPAITKEVLVYEGHEDEDAAKTGVELSKLFSNVEFIGYTEDRGKRPVFHCRHTKA